MSGAPFRPLELDRPAVIQAGSGWGKTALVDLLVADVIAGDGLPLIVSPRHDLTSRHLRRISRAPGGRVFTIGDPDDPTGGLRLDPRTAGSGGRAHVTFETALAAVHELSGEAEALLRRLRDEIEARHGRSGDLIPSPLVHLLVGELAAFGEGLPAALRSLLADAVIGEESGLVYTTRRNAPAPLTGPALVSLAALEDARSRALFALLLAGRIEAFLGDGRDRPRVASSRTGRRSSGPPSTRRGPSGRSRRRRARCSRRSAPPAIGSSSASRIAGAFRRAS